MATDSLRVLGISGSLRAASLNTALLHATVEIAKLEKLPLAIEIADIRSIPHYDEDVRTAGLPDAVKRFRDAIAAADALLIVTPEYNHSVPGVLKNAIDWASRPPTQPFAGKPLAIMGATPGLGGTMRMQEHLRQIATALDMHTLNKPDVLVRDAKNAFDADGKLCHEGTRKVITQQLTTLVEWTRRLKATASGTGER